MVSKRDLGVGYLIAVGVGLFATLTGGLLWPVEPRGIFLTPNTVMGMLAGLIVSGGFTLAGVGLANSELAGDRVWRVALWSTVGLGVPTILIILLAGSFPESLAGLGWRSVAMINIAGGGIVGILVGTLTELRAEHDRTVGLNQRNTVFLRLYRHDIRNSAGAILGHTDLMAEKASLSDRSIEVIRKRMNHIAQLSEAARQLDDLESETTKKPIDLIHLVRNQVEVLRSSHPSVDFETDFPPDGAVLANDLLRSVVDNILRNAIVHNDGHLIVRVTITPTGTKSREINLQIEDNGPGFSENELAVHSRTNETALRHSDGIGLWLSRWIVDSYDGELAIDNTDKGGAIVTVTLPSE